MPLWAMLIMVRVEQWASWQCQVLMFGMHDVEKLISRMVEWREALLAICEFGVVKVKRF